MFQDVPLSCYCLQISRGPRFESSHLNFF